MGRWRGKKRNWNNKGGATANANGAGGDIAHSAGSNVFNFDQLRQVRTYLKSYRKLAERVYRGELRSVGINALVEPVTIAGVEFPALTDEACAVPYLALAATLTSKRRRAIHELCVDGK
jgi:hypothetical protein